MLISTIAVMLLAEPLAGAGWTRTRAALVFCAKALAATAPLFRMHAATVLAVGGARAAALRGHCQ